MTSRPPEDPLKELEGRIEAVREARKPKPVVRGGKFSAVGFGWRMTIDLVTGICVGAAIGWGLDGLFGTLPVFLIVFIMFGFAAGVRVMLQSAKEYEKEQASAKDAD